MDAGELETNVLLIAQVTRIDYRLYDLPPDAGHAIGFETENTLRSSGYIVTYDASQKGLWVYRVVSKDDEATAINSGLEDLLKTESITLRSRDSGAIEPSFLHKLRLQSHQSHTTQSNSNSGQSSAESPRHPLAPSSQPPGSQEEQDFKALNMGRVDTAATLSRQNAIYECFIVALLHTISALFCAQAKALPLNYRTVLLPNDTSDSPFCRTSASDPSLRLGSFRTYMTSNGIVYWPTHKSIAKLRHDDL